MDHGTTEKNEKPEVLGCDYCVNGADLPFEFSFAFQPIVNVDSREIFSYEALVRGPKGESAASVLGQVNHEHRYRFDQVCRTKIIKLAAELNIGTFLNINFMPNAVYQAKHCIRTTLAAAKLYEFPPERIMFEVIESEKIDDHAHLLSIITEYQTLGFKTALDDFGAGHSQLNLLSEFQPDYLKLDLALIRNIDQNRVLQAIVKGIVDVCRTLDIVPVAEGIESAAEWQYLHSIGISLFQGYYFAKPAFESLPEVPSERYDGIGAPVEDDPIPAQEHEEIQQLVYVSAASTPFDTEALVSLLEKSRSNNTRVDVTGLLVYKDGSFLQILEGCPENVDKVFQKITADTRHERVSLVTKRCLEHRSFGEWSMAFGELRDGDIERLIGYVPESKAGSLFSDLAEETELLNRVIEGFSEGQWRQRLK